MSAFSAQASVGAEAPEADGGPATSWLSPRLKICVGVILLAHLPLLLLLAQYQWSRPHYQCFPVVLAAFIYFVVTRWNAFHQKPQPRRSLWSSLMLLAGLLLLIAGVILFSPWLAGVAMILVTGSLLLLLTGDQFYSKFLGPWCLLWLIMPLPMQLDIRLIGWLQTKTSTAAGTVLDLMGIRHFMSGNVLEFPETKMLVEEACSGIHSLFALIAFVGLFAVWASRPAVHSLVLLVSAAFWAALTNFLRVLTVAVAFARYDIDLATGWVHDVVGVVFFGFALLMLLSTDQFLMSTWPIFDFSWLPFGKSEQQRAVARRKRVKAERYAAETGQRLPATPWTSWAVVSVFAVMAVLQIGEFAFATAQQMGAAKEHPVGETVIHLSENSLPQTHNHWNRVRFDVVKRSASNSFGENSKTWRYETPICNVAVSLDYPFTDWHELSYCYGGHGWKLHSRRSSESAGWTTAGSGIPFVELILNKPTGEYGYVLFTLMDDRGDAIPPPDRSLSSTLQGRVLEGPLARVFGRESKLRLNAKTYQVQVFASSERELSESEREQVRSQFLSFADIIRKQRLGD